MPQRLLQKLRVPLDYFDTNILKASDTE